MRYFCVSSPKVYVRTPSVDCKTMKDVLSEVELYGSDLGEQTTGDFMFLKPEDVDMDAFHERYINKQDLGSSTDAPTFFDKLGERFGYACRKESGPVSSPVESVSESNVE